MKKLAIGRDCDHNKFKGSGLARIDSRKVRNKMTTFHIENVRIETITDFDMVKFDLVTEIGRVELSEHVNYESDGDFKSVEFTDSNIRCHLEDELCSVFDMSEKPSLMPAIDYVPFAEVIEAVEEMLEA
ncbi:AcrF10 family anti-CRISPR protein [Shewanella algae]|uniref:AcrF10 family anti-CRISPR protein n=1 Tax=Shewanella algae TaxID=38313 RepID=UPI0031F4E636